MLHRATLVPRLFRAHVEHGYERKSALNKHVLLPALHTELQHQQHKLNGFQTEPRRNTCEEPAREVADARLSQRWGCDAATCPHFSAAHTTTAMAPLSTPHFSFMQKLRGISASEEAFLKPYAQTSLLDHGNTTEMMPLIERM